MKPIKEEIIILIDKKIFELNKIRYNIINRIIPKEDYKEIYDELRQD